LFFWYFRQPIAKTPAPIFNGQCVKWRRFAQLYAFWVSKIKLIFRPLSVLVLPRCMECRRGLTIRILSVCPSVKRVI